MFCAAVNAMVREEDFMELWRVYSMAKEYISIKEFAELAGVSQQAIYKQLNNKLKSYLKVVDGKKTLDKSALELFKKQENSSGVEQQLINMLQTELNQKNEQIAQLQKLLDQEQQLHAMARQELKLLEEKKQESEVEVPEPPEPEKKSWWQRIFDK